VEPDDVPPQRRVISMPGKASVEVLWGHLGGLRRTDDDYLACVLANAALGGSTLVSRLGRRVRDREGLTYGIFSFFAHATLIPGPWVVSLTTSAGNVERALTSARKVVESTLRRGITARELKSEQTHFAGAFKVGLSTNAAIADKLREVGFYGLGPRTLDELPRKAMAVTLREANRALRRHLDPQRAVTVLAGPVSDGRSPSSRRRR
jgi:zinc protease